MITHPTGERSHYILGLDLGQKRDHSALAIVECHERVLPRRDPVTWDWLREQSTRIVHLERIALGTPYPAIVEDICQLLSDPRLETCDLVVDGTGVGAPIVDLLRREALRCRIVPITITGGQHDAPSHGGYSVPRKDLIGGLQVMFEKETLEISAELEMAEALIEELAQMRPNSRDDLVFATALACWWARKTESWRHPTGRLI